MTAAIRKTGIVSLETQTRMTTACNNMATVVRAWPPDCGSLTGALCSTFPRPAYACAFSPLARKHPIQTIKLRTGLSCICTGTYHNGCYGHYKRLIVCEKSSEHIAANYYFCSRASPYCNRSVRSPCVARFCCKYMYTAVMRVVPWQHPLSL